MAGSEALSEVGVKNKTGSEHMFRAGLYVFDLMKSLFVVFVLKVYVDFFAVPLFQVGQDTSLGVEQIDGELFFAFMFHEVHAVFYGYRGEFP